MAWTQTDIDNVAYTRGGSKTKKDDKVTINADGVDLRVTPHEASVINKLEKAKQRKQDPPKKPAPKISNAVKTKREKDGKPKYVDQGDTTIIPSLGPEIKQEKVTGPRMGVPQVISSEEYKRDLFGRDFPRNVQTDPADWGRKRDEGPPVQRGEQMDYARSRGPARPPQQEPSAQAPYEGPPVQAEGRPSTPQDRYAGRFQPNAPVQQEQAATAPPNTQDTRNLIKEEYLKKTTEKPRISANKDAKGNVVPPPKPGLKQAGTKTPAEPKPEDVQKVQEIITSHGDDVNEKDEKGTPLWLSLLVGILDIGTSAAWGSPEATVGTLKGMKYADKREEANRRLAMQEKRLEQTLDKSTDEKLTQNEKELWKVNARYKRREDGTIDRHPPEQGQQYGTPKIESIPSAELGEFQKSKLGSTTDVNHPTLSKTGRDAAKLSERIYQNKINRIKAGKAGISITGGIAAYQKAEQDAYKQAENDLKKEINNRYKIEGLEPPYPDMEPGIKSRSMQGQSETTTPKTHVYLTPDNIRATMTYANNPAIPTQKIRTWMDKIEANPPEWANTEDGVKLLDAISQVLDAREKGIILTPGQ